jgi:tetratricopeptide (TPR) repeat protein
MIKKSFYIILVFIISFNKFAYSNELKSKDPINLFEIGIEYFENNSYEDALDKFNESSKIYEEEFEKTQYLPYKDGIQMNYINMANCYIKLNRIKAAIEILNKSLDLNSNSFQTYKLLGKAYSFLAIELNDRGDIENYEKNLKKVIEIYLKALEIKDDDFFIYQTIGIYYYKLGNTDESISFLDKSLNLKQDAKSSNFFQSVNYYKKGFLDKALVYSKKELINNPNDNLYDALYNYLSGLDDYNKGRYYESLIKLRESFRLSEDIFLISKDNEKFGNVYFTLGNIYEKLNKLADAEMYYRESIKIDDNIKSYLNLIRIYQKNGSLNEEIELSKKMLTINPEMTSIKKSLGFAYYKKSLTNINNNDIESAVFNLLKGCDIGNTESCKLLEKYRYLKN